MRGVGYRNFYEAREYVRSLGLRSQTEWREWCKTGERPPDVPSTPERTYAKEWRGFGDWLGTFAPAPQDVVFRPVDEARMFARSLGLKSLREWQQWSKTDARPADIPASPSRTYSESWRGWRDWLGTENLTHTCDTELFVELSRLTRCYSQTTHARLKADPSQWWRFHELFRKSRKRWPEEPIEHVAELIRKEIPPKGTRLADLGCGECLLRDALPEYEITSVDHVSYDSDVISCDMARAPLEDSSFDVAVFCLSLLGSNWVDYLSEARRILRPSARLFIVESIDRWGCMRLETTLEEELFTEMHVQKRHLSEANRRGFVYVSALNHSEGLEGAA